MNLYIEKKPRRTGGASSFRPVPHHENVYIFIAMNTKKISELQ